MPSPRKRKTNKSMNVDDNTIKNSTSPSNSDTKNSPKTRKNSTKSKKKQHGLAAQDQIKKTQRNKLLIAVLLYIAIGAGVLVWKGMTRLPEIPPELENEILGSYPQQLKDIDMPKNMKKKSAHAIDDSKSDAKSKERMISVNLTSGWKELQLKNKKLPGRIFVKEDFLSNSDCEELVKGHKNRLKESTNLIPNVCFNDESALKSHMKNIDEKSASKISASDFMEGTTCLNASLTSQFKTISWSHSTSFYEGESKFLNRLDELLQKEDFENTIAGKLQITSYTQNIGNKAHVDCKENIGKLLPDFTLLVHLSNVEKGGDTEFVELGTTIKAQKGLGVLLFRGDSTKNVYDTFHTVSPVIKGANYILQRRWKLTALENGGTKVLPTANATIGQFIGYYKDGDPAISKRPTISEAPKGAPKLTPKVICGPSECGSCRWYDSSN